MELPLYGPYGFTAESGYPIVYSAAPERFRRGIYLWAVKLADRYRVNYIGKTSANFADRLRQETRRALAGLDGYFDEELFRRGIRKAISPPPTRAAEQLKRTMDCCLVFLGPLDVSDTDLLTVESVLIRQIQRCAPEAAEFLAKQRVPTNRVLPTPLHVLPPPNVRLEGLEEPFCA